MTWFYASGVTRIRFFDEDRHDAGAILCRPGEWTVVSPAERPLIRIRRTGDTTYLVTSGGERGSAAMTLEPDDLLCRLPRAAALTLTWPEHTAEIASSKSGALNWTLDGKPIGSVRVACRGSITCVDAPDVATVMLLYLFSYLMAHADDVDIV